jgi:hypothetical protein
MKTEKILELVDALIRAGYDNSSISVVVNDQKYTLKEFFEIDGDGSSEQTKRGIYVYNVDERDFDTFIFAKPTAVYKTVYPNSIITYFKV